MMLWPHRVFSCSDIWICVLGHKGASIGESLEYFGGKILGTRLGTGTQWLDRTGRQREMNFLWTLCNENEEEKAWDLLWHGRGCLGLLL
jgi:hypothetical protein